MQAFSFILGPKFNKYIQINFFYDRHIIIILSFFQACDAHGAVVAFDFLCNLDSNTWSSIGSEEDVDSDVQGNILFLVEELRTFLNQNYIFFGLIKQKKQFFTDFH